MSETVVGRVFSERVHGEAIWGAVAVFRGKGVHRVEERATERQARAELLEWAQRMGKKVEWAEAPGDTVSRRSVSGDVLTIETVARDSAAVGGSGPLSDGERRDLAWLEARVERSVGAMLDGGAALIEIRERRLYREKYKRFDDYCQAVWGHTARRARQLIAAAEVVNDLQEGPEGTEAAAPTGHQTRACPKARLVPVTESQARPLAPLPKDKRREVWTEAVRSAGGAQPTAKHVQEAKRKVVEPDLFRADGESAMALPVIGPRARAHILDATQRAVVSIRAVQDLVREVAWVARCNQAIRCIEEIEGEIRKTAQQGERAKNGALLFVIKRVLKGSPTRYSTAGGWTTDIRMALRMTEAAARMRAARHSDQVIGVGP